MLLEHRFTVPVPVEQAWDVLLDIERVAPCMPGATLTSAEGDTFAGTVKVKLGPVNMTFKGTGRFVERDEAARRVQMTASGMDSRGGGTAAARITASLHAVDEGTRVEVNADLDITGKAAQFGRGLIGDVSGKLIGQFASCLADQLSAAPPAPAASAEAAAGSDSGAASGLAAGVAAPEPLVPPEPVVPPESGASTLANAKAPGTASAVVTPTPAGPTVRPEAEPIDLLAVTGVTGMVRRAVPYVITAAASFAVVLAIIWWIKRDR